MDRRRTLINDRPLDNSGIIYNKVTKSINEFK